LLWAKDAMKRCCTRVAIFSLSPKREKNNKSKIARNDALKKRKLVTEKINRLLRFFKTAWRTGSLANVLLKKSPSKLCAPNRSKLGLLKTFFMQMRNLLLAVLIISTFSCATKYVTPGSPVKISELADADISKILSNKPASEFPVNIAIARIQSTDYTNYRYQKRYTENPQDKFSMILTRDAEEDAAFERLSKMEGVKQASPFNRLLLPYNYSSVKDLRLAAAKMKANMLMVYTFDTQFSIDTKNYGPQNIIALGYLKNKEVKVVTTASVALFDVQTEYLYGLGEASVTQLKRANAYKKVDEVDNLRLETEKKAFNELIVEVEKMWKGVMEEYAKK
jgi:hypothetical protein